MTPQTLTQHVRRQENAAAFFVELSQEDKTYLEETFAPDKVCSMLMHSFTCGSLVPT